MAIVKLFPQKDSTIYSDFNEMNAGIDEILDLSKQPSLYYTTQSAACRALIKISDDDLNSINDYVGDSPYSASLRMFLANANNIPLDITFFAYAISESWDMGTGRSANIPITINGVNWQNRKVDIPWATASADPNIGAFFQSNNPVGGNWYIDTLTTQSLNDRSNKDVNIDVTNMITRFVSGSLPNEGIIIMNDPAIEFDGNYTYTIDYFSIDTNTIYPPHIEVKWDDSIYTPDPSGSFVSEDFVINLVGNRNKYHSNAVERFNLFVRNRYPSRTFVTSSIFNSPSYLPSSSFYSVRDLDTDNIIFDFDDDFTKISTDENGSFFTLYMNGLEPDRFYKFLFKVEISGSIQILDDNYNFKISKK